MSRSSPRFVPSPFVVVLAGVIWGLLSFYFGIIFGMTLPGQEKPQWYSLLIYVFEGVAHLVTIWLCLLNWRLPQILSYHNIWLLFGLRSWFYFIANLFFGYWELGLQRSPEVSLADLFYIISYIFLLGGMFLAVRTRRVTLKTWQYGVIAVIATLGIWLGWVSSFPPEEAQATLTSTSPVVEQTMIASSAAPTLAQNNTLPVAYINVQPEAPGWVIGVEETLKPFAGAINLSYVILDIILLILAGTLILTLWGGQLSRTWLVITVATLLLYIADVRYAYIAARGNFETGGLLDTLWIFSAILFGIGASLEYDLSIHLPRRRR